MQVGHQRERLLQQIFVFRKQGPGAELSYWHGWDSYEPAEGKTTNPMTARALTKLFFVDVRVHWLRRTGHDQLDTEESGLPLSYSQAAG